MVCILFISTHGRMPWCGNSLMACGGVESGSCPFVPFLPGGGFPPRPALVFGASDIDRERDAFPVVLGCEVVSFGGRHLGAEAFQSRVDHDFNLLRCEQIKV